MDNMKKTGIIAGAIVGGLIGGPLSVLGKITKVKIIDDIGESVVDSTILTGTIAGNVVSGATDLASGIATGNQNKKEEGVDDLKETGRQVVNNFTNNIKLVAGSGAEIYSGIRKKDGAVIKHGIKSLVKITTVGLMTVGAIKIKPENTDETK